MPCSRTISTAPTGTTLSTTTPRRRSGAGAVSCGRWRRRAGRWWPVTCRSRRRPGGGRRRRVSLGTGHLGVLTACWVRAELDDRMRLNETDGRGEEAIMDVYEAV